MDLGFSRRDRSRDARAADADRLRSLLAEIAVRQAMTATAQMQAAPEGIVPPSQPAAALCHFAPTTAATRPAAFNPDVAAAIVNDRQDS